MLRTRELFTPALFAWQAGMCCLMAANIAARRAWPDSHVRWREAPAFLMRVFSLGESLASRHTGVRGALQWCKAAAWQ